MKPHAPATNTLNDIWAATRDVLQDLDRIIIEQDAFLACLAVWQPQTTVLKIHPIPFNGQTELFVTTDEDAAGAQLLRGVEGPFVLLNPGANRPDKRWPAARFAHLADDLLKARDLPAVVSGGPNERPLLRAVVDAARSEIVDLAERGITLGALKAVIRRAALVITNDTGPRHLAAALGTPVVSLFGPTDHRWTTLDAAREHLVVAEPFLPESMVADRHPRACGIDRIPVSDVLFASMRLLDETRGPAPA